MRRLTHTTHNAFLRALQISKLEVVGLVEGKKTDRYFYGRVCSTVCSAVKRKYRVAPAYEIPGKAGGKAALLSFHEFLRLNGQLVSSFKGQKTIFVFFLDKDIDDLLRKTVSSDHIVYTRTYDVEGEIVAASSVARAIASSASLDENDLIERIVDSADWCRRCAAAWKDWIVICIFCHKYGLQGCGSFRQPSQINQKLTGPVDNAKLTQRLLKLKAISGAAESRFERRLGAVRRFVEATFHKGLEQRIFKGKWFLYFAASEATVVTGDTLFDKAGLDAGFFSAASVTIDYSGTMVSYFRERVSHLIEAN